MMERIIAGDTSEFERAMVLGLSRSQGVMNDPLTCVALVGSRLKCNLPRLPDKKPVPPASYPPEAPFLSEQARTLAVKLLGGKDGQATDGIAMAVSRAIAAAGLCLHPFDYARLEGFIAATASQRTAPERAWLEKVRPSREPEDEPYADGPVTEDMLPRLGKSAKLQFIRELRLRDAAHARQVVESLWPNEPANLRADLLRLLQTNLSQADRDFLESLSGDRAQSVRETAAQLLARIAGTQAFADRMAMLKRHIEVASKGLLRRTRVLKFKGTDKGGARRDDAAESNGSCWMASASATLPRHSAKHPPRCLLLLKPRRRRGFSRSSCFSAPPPRASWTLSSVIRRSSMALILSWHLVSSNRLSWNSIRSISTDF